MLFQGILTSTLLLVGGVQATYHDGGAKRQAPQGNVKVHEVTVGKDGMLMYMPEKVTAEVGDKVQFTFYPKVSPMVCLHMLSEHPVTRL